MPDVHIVPGLWGIDGYSGITKMITARFDLVPGETYIEFPYDWRRDNRVAARALRRVADEKLHAARQRDPDAKLILIGHSMGGLVARYFLECLDGWKDTRMLITFGTPHRGSLNAVDFLTNGFVKKLGPLKIADLTRLLRSLTSVYQLLPTYPCVDLGEGGEYALVADASDSLAGVDAPRARAAADDFHGAIDTGVGAHEYGVYDLHSVVGITQGTKQSVRLDGGKVVCEELYKGTDLGGDGTVPRLSATPAETDGLHPVYQPMYSADRHAALQNADPVQTQLYGILTAELIDTTRSFLGVRLEAPELLDLGESLTVRALPDGANLTLLASVTDLATGLDVGTPITLNRDADDVHHGEIAPLPEGDYRLSVVGVGDSARLVDPVHGLFCVVPDLEPEPNEPPRG
jgi:hypothetical protein